MSLSLNEIYDKIDKAIINLSKDNWIDKWKIQKGVFYFLWLDSLYNKYNFKEITNKIDLHPDKQGPFSLAVSGEVDTLIKDGYLVVQNPNSKILPVKASQKGIDEFCHNLSETELIILSEIKPLIEKLKSDEVIFFIYFNPYIPDDIKEYFISESEIKEELIKKKELYIQKLIELGVIGDLMADKIRKIIDKIG